MLRRMSETKVEEPKYIDRDILHMVINAIDFIQYLSTIFCLAVHLYTRVKVQQQQQQEKKKKSQTKQKRGQLKVNRKKIFESLEHIQSISKHLHMPHFFTNTCICKVLKLK